MEATVFTRVGVHKFTGVESHGYTINDDVILVGKDNKPVAVINKDTEWAAIEFTPEEPEQDIFSSIATFMTSGGQRVPDEPLDSVESLNAFMWRAWDEVQETKEALTSEGRAEALDGFLDTAYAALSGAIAFVGVERAREAFAAVVDANAAKVDGRYGPAEIDKFTGKILKPEGWEAPDIERFV